MHIFWKYITDSSLNMLCAGIFVKDTLYSLYWNPKNFVNQKKWRITLKIFPWGTGRMGCKAVLLLWIFHVFLSVLCLLCLCMRLFICALRSPTQKGLTSWLSFVVSNCEFVTFPLVSWVRCGTWWYLFPIFATLLTLAMTWCSGSFQLKTVANKKVKIPSEYKSTNFAMIYAILW